jgi:uncharacterized protein (TIGR03083 family)
VDTIQAIDRIPPITRDTDARDLALATYDELLDLLTQLTADEWNARTECPSWTVADMVGHLIGAAKGHASVREMLRQQRWGKRHRNEFDGNVLDGMNALQVTDHAGLTHSERISELRSVAPRAVAGRMRLPGLMRRMPITLDAGGSTASGMPPKIRTGHLMDAILTRDVWMHRIDIARATRRTLDFSAPVHARIVADVVREWTSRHGQPVELILSGPAGGHFRQGEGGECLELDAVEFCRILSGRASGTGLLGTRIVF